MVLGNDCWEALYMTLSADFFSNHINITKAHSLQQNTLTDIANRFVRVIL